MDGIKKFYIRFGDHVEQVSEDVYRAYFKMGRRERYLEEHDLANGRPCTPSLTTTMKVFLEKR